jgi:hypothetical protein
MISSTPNEILMYSSDNNLIIFFEFVIIFLL